MKFIVSVLIIFLTSCAHNEPFSKAPDISFGDEQLRKMLADRPLMATYLDAKGESRHVNSSDVIWQWAAERFSGKNLGLPIDWNPESPNSWGCHDADNNGGNGGTRGWIRLREVFLCDPKKGSKRPFDSLWSDAAFELVNIEGAKEFDLLYDQAVECRMTKSEYVRANLLIEYQAKVKQADFYQMIWLPWTRQRGYHSDHTYWPQQVVPFEQWVKRYLDAPDEYWGQYFDKKLKPYRQKMGCTK